MEPAPEVDHMACITGAIARYEQMKREYELRIANELQRRNDSIAFHSRFVRQVDVVKATGFTRETIRRIVAASSQK